MNSLRYPSLQIASQTITFSSSDAAFMRAIEQECILSYSSKKAKIHIDLDHFFAAIKPQVPPLLNKIGLTKTHYMIFLFSAHLESRLIEKKIVFMHGCSFQVNSAAYLCVGPSGTGKTTVLSKIDSQFRMSNDTSIVEQKGNYYFIWKSPFDKPFYGRWRNPQKRKLAFIGVLEQAQTLEVGDLSPEKQLYHLLRNDLFIMNLFTFQRLRTDQRRTQRKIVAFYMSLMKKIPARLLKFQKDSNVRSHVSQIMEQKDT